MTTRMKETLIQEGFTIESGEEAEIALLSYRDVAGTTHRFDTQDHKDPSFIIQLFDDLILADRLSAEAMQFNRIPGSETRKNLIRACLSASKVCRDECSCLTA